MQQGNPMRSCMQNTVFGNEELHPFLEMPKQILTFIQTIDIGLKQRQMKKLKQNAYHHKINNLAEKTKQKKNNNKKTNKQTKKQNKKNKQKNNNNKTKQQTTKSHTTNILCVFKSFQYRLLAFFTCSPVQAVSHGYL